ncbi:PREDICTED: uncharacterized protein LOC106147435 [Chinchilla lanigera]|uniref:uncharacterized protein LOC106147435 n=1 Tax=Chinchilla lanigera TaxID=34839 RepID=UPI000697A922|nr:PREDICTED: uncharacterized protein LOC106147435 [Chinchilla lanigera]
MRRRRGPGQRLRRGLRREAAPVGAKGAGQRAPRRKARSPAAAARCSLCPPTAAPPGHVSPSLLSPPRVPFTAGWSSCPVVALSWILCLILAQALPVRLVAGSSCSLPASSPPLASLRGTDRCSFHLSTSLSLGLSSLFFSAPSSSVRFPPLSLSDCIFLGVPYLWASVPFSQGAPPPPPWSNPHPGRDSRLRHCGELQKWARPAGLKEAVPSFPDLPRTPIQSLRSSGIPQTSDGTHQDREKTRAPPLCAPNSGVPQAEAVSPEPPSPHCHLSLSSRPVASHACCDGARPTKAGKRSELQHPACSAGLAPLPGGREGQGPHGIRSTRYSPPRSNIVRPAK